MKFEKIHPYKFKNEHTAQIQEADRAMLKHHDPAIRAQVDAAKNFNVIINKFALLYKPKRGKKGEGEGEDDEAEGGSDE